eukprot:6148386-Prymnesium_polylepis.2
MESAGLLRKRFCHLLFLSSHKARGATLKRDAALRSLQSWRAHIRALIHARGRAQQERACVCVVRGARARLAVMKRRSSWSSSR